MNKDSVTSHLEKSIISNILSGARASLKEPSRPFTPAEVQRSLFVAPDRPPSAYSIKTLAKDLDPIRPKQASFEGPIQTKRRGLSEEKKSEVRKPVKAVPEANVYDEIPECEELNQLKNLIFVFDQMKVHSEARELYQREDLKEVLADISACLQKLKYVGQKPAWASVEEVMKSLALTVEKFESDSEKVLIIGKCVLDNIAAHELLYKRNKKGIFISSLASGSLKVLYQFSKKTENDEFFLNEKIIDTLYVLLINIVSEDTYLEIDLPYEFLIFLLGILKNTTNNEKLAKASGNFINPLSTLLPTPLVDSRPHKSVKHSNLLVQVTGVLSNLAGKVDTQELLMCQVVEKVTLALELYKDSELVLNCLKTVSKISLNPVVCTLLMNNINEYIRPIYDYENPLIVSRACYIVANILTVKENAREVCDKAWVDKLLEICARIQGNEVINIDLTLKAIRLMANLISHPLIGSKLCSAEAVTKYLVDVISKYNVEENEELILNTVACLTNLLYFDIPGKDFLSFNTRILVFSKLPSLLVSNFNEELTIETLRALGNLTRHESICKELPNLYMLDILFMLLDHSNYTILYYALGCLINISSLIKELLYCERYFEALVNLVENTFIYEMEISTHIFMVLSNLCTPSKGMIPWESVAGDENVKKLDRIVKELVKEISEIQSEEEEFRKLTRIVVGIEKLLPKPLIPCVFEGCGRKFATQELLKDHWDRRHA